MQKVSELANFQRINCLKTNKSKALSKWWRCLYYYVKATVGGWSWNLDWWQLTSMQSRSWIAWICRNFEAYVWKAWEVCGVSTSGIPTGHISWNFGKKTIVSSSSSAICERQFSKQNAIESHSRASLNLHTFGCFDASIIIRNTGGEYGLESNIWVTVQHKES